MPVAYPFVRANGDSFWQGQSIATNPLDPVNMDDEINKLKDHVNNSIDQELNISSSPTFAGLTLPANFTFDVGSLVGNTLKIRARDVDGASWVDVLTATSNNTATLDLLSTATVGGVQIRSGTIAITDGGTGQITAQEGIDALSQVSSATNEYVLTKDTATGKATWKASSTTTPTSDSSISIQVIGSPTVNTVSERHDSTGSSGFFSGGVISTGTGNTLDVASGSGFIRTTADPLAPLLSFEWSAVTSVALTDDSANYVFVGSAGTITVSTSEFIEAENKIILGVIVKEGGVVVSSFNFGVRLEESLAQAGRFLRRTLGISRDVRRGGLSLGETGTRNITLSTGHLWWGRTDYTITAIDTSVSGTFDAFYQDGVGGVTTEASRTTWNNTQYDDGTGTLATLANNKWAVQWFFIEPDEHLSMVYGTSSYNSMALAELEKVPTVLPPRISSASILVGRLIFQKSATTATLESAFDTTFVAGQASGDVLADGSVSFTGDLSQDSVTDSTSALTGSIHTDGGLGVAKKGFFGDVVSGVDPTADAHLATKAYVDAHGVVQVVYASTASKITTTSQIPVDITEPLDTEGVQILTATITPKSATNKLYIDVSISTASHSVADSFVCVALFKDPTGVGSASIRTTAHRGVGAENSTGLSLRHEIILSSITPITFTVRVGGSNAGTTSINTVNAGTFNLYGVTAESNITITEVGA